MQVSDLSETTSFARVSTSSSAIRRRRQAEGLLAHSLRATRIQRRLLRDLPHAISLHRFGPATVYYEVLEDWRQADELKGLLFEGLRDVEAVS